jgi:hypothetical protein
VKTLPGDKTSTLDRKTNQIFLITAQYAPPTPSTQPATPGEGGRRRGGGRGPMLPDSFTIIVVGK